MESSPSGATGRAAPMDSAARRAQILRCATRLFVERPHYEVSTADIAEAAQVARPLVHHYFGTRRELYLEVLRHLYDVPAATAPLTGTVDLEDAVDAGVTRYLDAVAAQGSLWLTMVDAVTPGQDPEVAAIMEHADRVIAERTVEALGVADRLRDPERFRALLIAFAGMAKAAARQWVGLGTLSRDEVHELLARTLLDLTRRELVSGDDPASRRRRT